MKKLATMTHSSALILEQSLKLIQRKQEQYVREMAEMYERFLKENRLDGLVTDSLGNRGMMRVFRSETGCEMHLFFWMDSKNYYRVSTGDAKSLQAVLEDFEPAGQSSGKAG